MASFRIRVDDTGRWVTAGGALTAGAVAVPLEAQPGWYLHADGVLRPVPRPTLVSTCQTAHDTIDGLQDLIESPTIRRHYLADDWDLAHDILVELHPFIYVVAHDTGRNDLQKITLIAAAAQGPQGFNPAVPTSFFSQAHEISAADRTAFRALAVTGVISPVAMAPPHGRRTWSQFVTVNVLGDVSATSKPGPDDLADGAWIRSLP